MGAKLHGDRRDPGSHGGPRRLSTPKLPDSDQIRLRHRIHAVEGPANPHIPTLDSLLVAMTKQRRKPLRPITAFRFFVGYRPIVRGRVPVGWRDRWAPWVRRMRRTGWAGRPTPVLPFVQDCTNEQGAHEPPWMGLRRVPPTHPYPTSQGKHAHGVAAVALAFGVLRRTASDVRKQTQKTPAFAGVLRFGF